MRKNAFICMLSVTAMLTSCSQNEELLQGTGENNGTATFTVNLDEGMRTRAYTEDNNNGMRLTAYVLNGEGSLEATIQGAEGEASEEGVMRYTFTVSGLKAEEAYRIVCWASHEGEYTVEGTTVSMAEGKTNPALAYYGSTGAEPQTLEQMGKTIEMTHAVGKVTLVTTKSLEEGRSVRLEVPTYSQFDLASGTVTGEMSETSATDTSYPSVEAQEESGANLCAVYVLCGSEVTNGVTVTTIDGEVENTESAKTIDNVPVRPNVHVVLKGDANLGISGNVEFTAEIATSWNEGPTGDIEYGYEAHVIKGTHTIQTYKEGQIDANPELITEAMNGSGILKVVGPMNQADVDAISANKATITELDLSGATGEIEITDRSFSGLGGATVSLQTLKLGSNVTSIDYAAFARNASLQEVDLSACSNLTLIDASAFASCGGITSLKLPMNGKLKTIGTSAFMNSDNIKSITFPETLKQTGYCIFNETNIETLVFLGQEPPLIAKYDDVTDLGNFTDLFYVPNKMSNVTIYLPNVQREDAAAKGWTTFFVDETNYSGVKYGESPTE